MPLTVVNDKEVFANWFHSTYKVAVWFEGDNLHIPPRSGKSVPAIAHVAWAAWNKRAQLLEDKR